MSLSQPYLLANCWTSIASPYPDRQPHKHHDILSFFAIQKLAAGPSLHFKSSGGDLWVPNPPWLNHEKRPVSLLWYMSGDAPQTSNSALFCETPRRETNCFFLACKLIKYKFNLPSWRHANWFWYTNQQNQLRAGRLSNTSGEWFPWDRPTSRPAEGS